MARLVPSLKKRASDEGKDAKHLKKGGKRAGNSLSPTLRHRLETSLHQNLSDVRIHEDHKATLAGANAFSEGKDVFFAPGQYQPHTSAGYEMISHEVAHLIQQGMGHVNVQVPKGMTEVLDAADLKMLNSDEGKDQ